jgi:hypothetical protein
MAMPWYDDGDSDVCDHDDFDVDWEGRAHCHYCPFKWWLTMEELEAHQRAKTAWELEFHRERRRAFWQGVWREIRNWIPFPFGNGKGFFAPHHNAPDPDDEIPF